MRAYSDPNSHSYERQISNCCLNTGQMKTPKRVLHHMGRSHETLLLKMIERMKFRSYLNEERLITSYKRLQPPNTSSKNSTTNCGSSSTGAPPRVKFQLLLLTNLLAASLLVFTDSPPKQKHSGARNSASYAG